jgi:hypothetical protein
MASFKKMVWIYPRTKLSKQLKLSTMDYFLERDLKILLGLQETDPSL